MRSSPSSAPDAARNDRHLMDRVEPGRVAATSAWHISFYVETDTKVTFWNVAVGDEAKYGLARDPEIRHARLAGDQRASSVFPVPGGAISSTPVGTRAPNRPDHFGSRRKATTSCNQSRERARSGLAAARAFRASGAGRPAGPLGEDGIPQSSCGQGASRGRRRSRPDCGLTTGLTRADLANLVSKPAIVRTQREATR